MTRLRLTRTSVCEALDYPPVVNGDIRNYPKEHNERSLRNGRTTVKALGNGTTFRSSLSALLIVAVHGLQQLAYHLHKAPEREVVRRDDISEHTRTRFVIAAQVQGRLVGSYSRPLLYYLSVHFGIFHITLQDDTSQGRPLHMA